MALICCKPMKVNILVQDLIVCYLNNNTVKDVENYLSMVARAQILEWINNYDEPYLVRNHIDDIPDMIYTSLTCNSSFLVSLRCDDEKLEKFESMISDEVIHFLEGKYPNGDNILDRIYLHIIEVFRKISIEMKY